MQELKKKIPIVNEIIIKKSRFLYLLQKGTSKNKSLKFIKKINKIMQPTIVMPILLENTKTLFEKVMIVNRSILLENQFYIFYFIII